MRRFGKMLPFTFQYKYPEMAEKATVRNPITETSFNYSFVKQEENNKEYTKGIVIENSGSIIHRIIFNSIEKLECDLRYENVRDENILNITKNITGANVKERVERGLTLSTPRGGRRRGRSTSKRSTKRRKNGKRSSYRR
jgi:hypothetical protein